MTLTIEARPRSPALDAAAVRRLAGTLAGWAARAAARRGRASDFGAVTLCFVGPAAIARIHRQALGLPPAGFTERLAASRRGRAGLQLVVEDDGPGIEPDDVGKVLQRGVRGDERVQGHGIGLSIVQDLVRDYRGELQVARSQELGGARFEVTLPPGL